MSRQWQVAADPTASASVATSRAISWRKTDPMMTIERSVNSRLSEHPVCVGALRFNIVSLRKIVERRKKDLRPLWRPPLWEHGRCRPII
jgi:hypothetical protein